MAAPIKVYAKRLRANITAEQESAIQREAALTGQTPSEITRRALARTGGQNFASMRPPEERRHSPVPPSRKPPGP